MNCRVGRVDKLSGDEAARNLFRQFLCFGDGALHSLGAFRQYQLCAVGLQDVSSLNAHGLRHRQDDAVSFSGCDRCKSDSGVSGGGFDDDGAFLEKSFLLRIFDHGLRDTVLNASSRIEILELYQNGCFKSQFLLYINHLNERCVSDQSQSSFVNV